MRAKRKLITYFVFLKYFERMQSILDFAMRLDFTSVGAAYAKQAEQARNSRSSRVLSADDCDAIVNAPPS